MNEIIVSYLAEKLNEEMKNIVKKNLTNIIKSDTMTISAKQGGKNE